MGSRNFGQSGAYIKSAVPNGSFKILSNYLCVIQASLMATGAFHEKTFPLPTSDAELAPPAATNSTNRHNGDSNEVAVATSEASVEGSGW